MIKKLKSFRKHELKFTPENEKIVRAVKEITDNKENTRNETFCYICETRIESKLHRGFLIKGLDGKPFEIYVHYFPPCFDKDYIKSNLPPGCEITAQFFSFDLDDFKKYPEYFRKFIMTGENVQTDQAYIPSGTINLETNKVILFTADSKNF